MGERMVVWGWAVRGASVETVRRMGVGLPVTVRRRTGVSDRLMMSSLTLSLSYEGGAVQWVI